MLNSGHLIRLLIIADIRRSLMTFAGSSSTFNKAAIDVRLECEILGGGGMIAPLILPGGDLLMAPSIRHCEIGRMCAPQHQLLKCSYKLLLI